MKRIIICITCIAVTGIYVNAQNKHTTPTSPTATKSLAVIPPPPPPPAPPVPPIPPVPPTDLNLPVPPLPPVPPVPPVPSEENIAIVCTGTFASEIINGNGYEISVCNIKAREMVIIKKDGKTRKIKLCTWNADRKYYEKKYGQLPPVEV
jgi:hypothetical protein